MSQSKKKDAKKGKLSSTQKILIVGIVVIVLAIVAVGAYAVSRMNAKEKEDSNGPAFGSGTVVLDERNANDVINRIKEEEGRYSVKMVMDWDFPDGKSPSGNAYVANSEDNTHPVYFDVALEDGTVIYTSPMLPVGSAVEGFQLDTPLDAGKYTAVCTYHLLQSEEELTEISTVSVAVRITVKA